MTIAMLLNVILVIAACVAGAVIGELVINHGVIRVPALLGGVIGGAIGGYLVAAYRSKTPTSIPQL
jgi:hypothetical protein